MQKLPYEIKNTSVQVIERFKIVKDVLQIGKEETIYSYININPGVCIFASFQDEIVCLKEYRHPIKQWTYEFPAGFIEQGETPEQAAIREVKEETGYHVQSIVSLGYFYPSFGSTDEKIDLFYAICDRFEGAALDISEVINTKLIKFNDMEGLIRKNQFLHGAGLIAWMRGKELFEGHREL